MSQDLTEVRCRCMGCTRSVPKDRRGTRICARCARYVPSGIWLAIHDLVDSWNTYPSECSPFLWWCHSLLLQVAAHEAARYRVAKRQGRDADEKPHRRWCIEKGQIGVEFVE